jgi:hypothetical protein
LRSKPPASFVTQHIHSAEIPGFRLDGGMMNTMILLKCLIYVLDNLVGVSFSVSLFYTDMAGKKDIGGVNRPYVKAVYAADPWHLQNILEDFVKFEAFGDTLHENMDCSFDHPEAAPKDHASDE